jgi:hypothetical protein
VSPKIRKHPDNIDVRRLTSASVTAQMGTPVASIIARDTPALFTLPEGIPTRITLVRFNGTLPSCSNRSSHQRYSLFHRQQLGIYVSNKEFCVSYDLKSIGQDDHGLKREAREMD